MSAPVRIEAEAWSDLRFATLARILGLGSPDYALIRTARIWSWQAEHYTPEAPTYVVDLDTIESALGTGGAAALVRARLAEETPDGFRMRGAHGRIEWLWQKRQAARAGGEATKRKHGNKQGPHGLPHGEPAAGPELSPLVIALDQISEILPARDPAARVPEHQPAPTPLPGPSPSLSSLWDELEAERQAVAAHHGIEYRPLVAHDRGRHELAQVLAEAARVGTRDQVVGQVRHAIAVAGAEARADRDRVKWLTGAIFSPDNFRRLVAEDLEQAGRARAGPRGSAERAPEPIRKIKTL